MSKRPQTPARGKSAASKARRASRRPRLKQVRTRHIRTATLRNAVLETARALYSIGGYEAVTMRKIAEELGLAAPSLYHHFASKEEIFLAIQQKAVDMLLATEMQTSTVDPIEDLRLFFWRYYEFSKNYPDYFAILYADRSAPSPRRR